MFKIKHLETRDEFMKLKELYLSSLTKSGITISNPDAVFYGLYKFYPFENKFVGAFDGDRLVASMRYYVWETSPSYFINAQFVDESIYSKFIIKQDHPGVPVINFIIEQMEKEKRYTWYKSEPIAGNAMFIKKNSDPLIHCDMGRDLVTGTARYDQYVDEVIKGGTRSKNSAFDLLIYSRQWENSLRIVQHCLKPEYRHE